MFLLVLPLFFQLVQGSAKQPNVIFLFSDDQRYDSLTMTGDPVNETPHLDKLADEGVFFSKCFMTSPICGPSRANIFTGQWERKNRIGFHSYSKNVVTKDAFENSFLYKLKQAGYSTAFIGKHHTQIVDGRNQLLKDNVDFCYYGVGHLSFHPAKGRKVFANLKNKSQTEALFEATEAFLSEGEEFDYFYENMDKSSGFDPQRRDSSKPFCAWINLNLPHQSSLGGMGSDESDPGFYSKRYQDKLDQLPFPKGYPLDCNLPKDVMNPDELPGYYRLNKERLISTKLQTARAIYGIDLFVKNLRQLLKNIGEDENTIIIFSSDNGLMYGEQGMSGKSMLYEDSVHVPLIVYSPFLKKKDQGLQIDELVVGQDIPATILDMCGLSIPDTYQGASMLPLIKGENVEWRKDVFLENLFTDQSYPRHEAVRGQRYKYIRYFKKDEDRKKYLPYASIEGEEAIYEELFDLEADPEERNNLAANPEYIEVLKVHRLRCKDMVKELADRN